MQAVQNPAATLTSAPWCELLTTVLDVVACAGEDYVTASSGMEYKSLTMI